MQNLANLESLKNKLEKDPALLQRLHSIGKLLTAFRARRNASGHQVRIVRAADENNIGQITPENKMHGNY